MRTAGSLYKARNFFQPFSMTSCEQCSRLKEALDLVNKAMNSPNAFENSKESTFSALRRGCLDLRKNIDLFDSDDFSHDHIRDAWLFLIELSRAKLRRKHALECINIMLLSPRWGSVLRNDPSIQAKLPELSKDMQIALGHVEKPAPMASPVPSTAAIPPAGLVRKISGIIPSLPAVSRSKSTKIKRNVNAKIVSEEPTPARSESSSPRTSRGVPVVVLQEPIVSPPPPSQPLLKPVESESDLNPFRSDFNPFKEARGQNQRSNPFAIKAKGPMWWQDQPVHSSTSVWWS